MSDDWTLDYVRAVMAQTDMTASALAGLVGVSSTTLTRPLNDPNHPHGISLKTLEKIRAKTGIEFPRGDDDIIPPIPAQTGIGMDMVRVYDVSASAGDGHFVDYEPQAGSLAFPTQYLQHLTSSAPRHLAIISVKGESMEPTLLDDDIVLVDTSKRSLGFDGLFVLRMDGALHVKRVSRGPREGVIRIISDNAGVFPPVEREIEDVAVIGKVLWYGRKV